MVLPAPATHLPEIQGRQRKIKGEDRERGGPRSCYQYKNWTWTADGQRGAPVVVKGIRAEVPDLINSAYWNPATCTQTVYALVWDLDADKTDPKWLTKKGALKWKKMRKVLANEHPDIMRYVFAEQRSTSGKGISLALAQRLRPPSGYWGSAKASQQGPDYRSDQYETWPLWSRVA